MAEKCTRRERFEIMRRQMEAERSSFIPHYTDLGNHIRPRRPRFNVSDVNKGDRRNTKIVDSTATLASRTLRSGMMGGVTSPARPWFRLAIAEPDLNEIDSVKKWLHLVSTRMNTIFLRSNLYNTLPIIYGDMGDFATAAMFVEEDFDNVLRTFAVPIGSFMLANSDKGKVEVFTREFRMTVRQVIEKFGRQKDNSIDWTNISNHVKEQYDRGNLEAWIDIVHTILPNNYHDENKFGSKNKKFSSVYYEQGGSSTKEGGYMQPDEDKLLSEKGYDYFPVLAPRWEVTGEDVYGTACPGMDSLGDNKQLQLGQKRLMQAIDLIVKPPMKGPVSLMGTKTSILPGDITYSDELSEKGGFKPAFQIDPRIRELGEIQQQLRERISRTYYEDLFLMLANTDRRDITAREIEERHEEKLLALGPVLEQLNQDLLDPLIDITFDFMLRQGLIPEPPQEIQGAPLRVEYLSIMAQAQKVAGIGYLERLMTVTNQIGVTNAEVYDKVDTDQWIDSYSDILSIPPGVIRSDEAVAAIRANRAKAQQAQAQTEMLNQTSQAAKNFSQADMGTDSALTRLMEQAEAGGITAA